MLLAKYISESGTSYNEYDSKWTCIQNGSLDEILLSCASYVTDKDSLEIMNSIDDKISEDEIKLLINKAKKLNYEEIGGRVISIYPSENRMAKRRSSIIKKIEAITIDNFDILDSKICL